MLVVKKLALFPQFGLELFFSGEVSVAFLLESLEFTFTGGSGFQALLGEGDGFSGEGLVDTGLDGVDHIFGLVGQGLTVPGGGGSQVQAALADVAGQVRNGAGLGDLVGDEGGQAILSVELIVDAAIAENLEGVTVRGAHGGVGVEDDGVEVVGERVASASATGGTLGDVEHGVGDEGLQVCLEEPGEASQVHGLGDDLHPGCGAVSKESFLRIRGRHAEKVD